MTLGRRGARASARPPALHGPAGAGAAAPTGRGRGLVWVVVLAGLLVAVAAVRALLVAPFSIPSGSMQPTLEVGDRILVDRTVSPEELRRGDVVVFDAARAFALGRPGAGPLAEMAQALGALVGHGPETDYVKRVIGLPGDRVRCCDTAGRVVVNDQPLDEPYLYPGDVPSAHPFDVTVPAGSFWVLGDHRSASADSRAHLGDPGGGMVPGADIIGQVWVRYWPLGRAGRLAPAPQPSPASPRNGQ